MLLSWNLEWRMEIIIKWNNKTDALHLARKAIIISQEAIFILVIHSCSKHDYSCDINRNPTLWVIFRLFNSIVFFMRHFTIANRKNVDAIMNHLRKIILVYSPRFMRF